MNRKQIKQSIVLIICVMTAFIAHLNTSFADCPVRNFRVFIGIYRNI